MEQASAQKFETARLGDKGQSYLIHDIVEGIWAIDGEADENEVGLWVGKRAQAVVFFLSGCVP